jgi:hypothetical protein
LKKNLQAKDDESNNAAGEKTPGLLMLLVEEAKREHGVRPERVRV